MRREIGEQSWAYLKENLLLNTIHAWPPADNANRLAIKKNPALHLWRAGQHFKSSLRPIYPTAQLVTYPRWMAAHVWRLMEDILIMVCGNNLAILLHDQVDIHELLLNL